MKKISSKAKLRIEFIGMAFALAIGQVGLEIGEFYSHHLKVSNNWFVLTHLTLGTYIIASSWVGWQKSKSKGHLEEIDNTFSKAFIILLVDLFLVICYFIIVKSVEKPYEDSDQSKISSGPELFWSIVIFSTYIGWDILTKLFDFNSKKFKLKFHWNDYIKRAYQAWVCILLVLGCMYTLPEREEWRSVVQVDLYLLLTFILFRGMKENLGEPKKHKHIPLIKFALYILIPISGIILYYLINSHKIFLH